jgi:ParB family chromosome partitioning protein
MYEVNMMKHGLGKGLDALFDMNEDEKGVSTIDIDSISRDPSQPRKHFDKEELDALAQSIVQNGVIQPIIVRQTPVGYTIVAGERRFRAAKQAGLAEIPIIIKDLTDLQVLEISLVENLQREDLNAIEEANAYRRLADEFGLTQEKIAENIGKSRVSITNKLRLLGLSQYIQDLLIEGKISEGHARAILAIEDEVRRIELADFIVKKGLNVREAEKLAKKKKKEPKEPEPVEYEEEFQRVENDLAKKLGTKVSISRNLEKGKITIEYYSMDGLNRIIDIIQK